jgi:hypothetical protein
MTEQMLVGLMVVSVVATPASQDPPRRDSIVVTSVVGAWQSRLHGALAALERLEVGDEVTCTSGEGELRLSANGVPIAYGCKQGTIKVTLPRSPGLSERWLKSLGALWAKPALTFVPLASRGQGPIEAVVPAVSNELDLSRALVGIDTSKVVVRLHPLEPDGGAAATEREWRSSYRLQTHRTYGPGLYRLQLVTREGHALGEQALVFVPPPARAEEALSRFAEIRTLTESWLPRDARSFQAYCLAALAEELK